MTHLGAFICKLWLCAHSVPFHYSLFRWAVHSSHPAERSDLPLCPDWAALEEQPLVNPPTHSMSELTGTCNPCHSLQMPCRDRVFPAMLDRSTHWITEKWVLLCTLRSSSALSHPEGGGEPPSPFLCPKPWCAEPVSVSPHQTAKDRIWLSASYGWVYLSTPCTRPWWGELALAYVARNLLDNFSTCCLVTGGMRCHYK